jgi:hypothetical protein
MRARSSGLSGRARRSAITDGAGAFGTDVVVVAIFLSGRSTERRCWCAGGALTTNLSRNDDAVVANQVRDDCAVVIVSALEDWRIIGANDRSSRLCGYDRDEVIRWTFPGLGLAASRKHREVPSAVGEVGVSRLEIVATIRTKVGP